MDKEKQKEKRQSKTSNEDSIKCEKTLKKELGEQKPKKPTPGCEPPSVYDGPRKKRRWYVPKKPTKGG